MAGLGWGGPAALGVQAAVGSVRRVFALVGDGAWGYSLAEMESAVRCDLPVVVVILNNSMLAWVHHGLARSGRFMSSTFGDTDYAGAAEACGALGLRVGPDDDLEAAFARALRSERPSLIDVRSSQDLSPIPPLPEDAALAVRPGGAYM
jgi:acetolactate synthase-1/2/3 large subunit